MTRPLEAPTLLLGGWGHDEVEPFWVGLFGGGDHVVPFWVGLGGDHVELFCVGLGGGDHVVGPPGVHVTSLCGS